MTNETAHQKKNYGRKSKISLLLYQALKDKLFETIVKNRFRVSYSEGRGGRGARKK